jgi:hypothetical protein
MPDALALSVQTRDALQRRQAANGWWGQLAAAVVIVLTASSAWTRKWMPLRRSTQTTGTRSSGWALCSPIPAWCGALFWPHPCASDAQRRDARSLLEATARELPRHYLPGRHQCYAS